MSGGAEKASGQGNFQAGQTAKARPGLPCAVTPKRDMAAAGLANQETIVVVCIWLFHPQETVEIVRR